ncbi:hypothetical protein LTR94_033571, partial [Friedmanniomyces endolithicus]
GLGRGVDRQHLLDRGAGGGAGHGRLQRHQGGGLALHQDGGAGGGQGGLERARQLGAPRLHQDADPRSFRRHGGRRRGERARKAGARHSAEAHRRAGRRGLLRALPGLGRVQVRDRRRVQDRRRADGTV